VISTGSPVHLVLITPFIEISLSKYGSRALQVKVYLIITQYEASLIFICTLQIKKLETQGKLIILPNIKVLIS
jgi:hypothetical protein